MTFVRTAARLPFSDSAPDRDNAILLRRRALEQGYLFFRRFIEPGMVLALRRSVLEACNGAGWLDPVVPLMDGIASERLGSFSISDPSWISIQANVLSLASFAQLGTLPPIVEVLEAVLDGPLQPRRGDVCRVVPPGGESAATPPHQDAFYTGAATKMWTVWIPLGACPIELGGLAVLPASHRNGLWKLDPENPAAGIAVPENASWVTGDYDCGDVLMFDGLTIHRSLPNRTRRRLRLSVDYRYAAIRSAG